MFTSRSRSHLSQFGEAKSLITIKIKDEIQYINIDYDNHNKQALFQQLFFQN